MTDEQLGDLFSKMKRENQERKAVEMQKFDFGKDKDGANEALDDELGGLEDDEEDEAIVIGDDAGRQFAASGGKVGDAAGLKGDVNKPEEPKIIYFNDNIKEQLKVYRI